MKLKGIILLVCAAVACAMFFGCKSGKADQAVIEEYIVPLNTEYSSICASSELVSEAYVALEGNTLKATVHFGSDAVKVPQLTEALVQYGVAFWLKQHTGLRLDNILNALGRMQGSLELTLSDVDNNSRTYTISSSRLKQLVRLRPMELNFNEVKGAISDIMSDRCANLRADTRGCTEVVFALDGGFAQYTLTFGRPSDIASCTQGSLARIYVNMLKPEYEAMGDLRPYVQSILESLQIEGYRFIYSAGADNTVRTVISWRMLN